MGVWLFGWLANRINNCLIDWEDDGLVLKQAGSLLGWLVGGFNQVDCLVDWLDDCLVGLLIAWLVSWMDDCLDGWLSVWLVGRLLAWLVGWLIAWLVG